MHTDDFWDLVKWQLRTNKADAQRQVLGAIGDQNSLLNQRQGGVGPAAAEERGGGRVLRSPVSDRSAASPRLGGSRLSDAAGVAVAAALFCKRAGAALRTVSC